MHLGFQRNTSQYLRIEALSIAVESSRWHYRGLGQPDQAAHQFQDRGTSLVCPWPILKGSAPRTCVTDAPLTPPHHHKDGTRGGSAADTFDGNPLHRCRDRGPSTETTGKSPEGRSPGWNQLGAEEVNRWETRFERVGGPCNLLSLHARGIIGIFHKGIKRHGSFSARGRSQSHGCPA